jgi:D-sedoheptulose 7-phosphate isomerase
MNFIKKYIEDIKTITSLIEMDSIEKCVDILASTRENKGRLFILGVGGSAGNASHAVNDFRKICGIETYAPTDNVSELTARTNDDGWPSIFVEWLKISRLTPNDTLLILSVGGGNIEKNVSPNLVNAIKFAKNVGSGIIGILGKDGGYASLNASACVIIPTVDKEMITPYSEAFQAVIWHLFVSHPKLKKCSTKWESIK